MSPNAKMVIFLSGPPGAGKTTIASELALLIDAAVVEVDDIKVERHGTTELCDPELDFPEAGTRAAISLRTRPTAIVVEAFADDEHVELVRNRLPLPLHELHILLECDVKVAAVRKKETLGEDTIRWHFERFAVKAFRGRRRVNTTKLDPAAVARTIAGWVTDEEH